MGRWIALPTSIGNSWCLPNPGYLGIWSCPKGMEVPFSMKTGKYGTVADPLTAAAAAMKKGLKIIGGKPVFFDDKVKGFWNALEKADSLHVISGKLPVTTIIPVGDNIGYLSQTEQTAAMKVNASFFIMDRFDCSTIYDHVGTPLGLLVKDGVVKNPPLFAREALLVRKDGSVRVEQPKLPDLKIEIGGISYEHGKNAVIYSRPDRNRTPIHPGKKLVIIGNRVAAVCSGISAVIPTSGFVLCPDGECNARPGDAVTYRGMEDVCFGIQVGNSIIKNGVKTEKFISRFYNIKALERVPFPPSLYPLDFQKARAARIALGADEQGKPIIVWAEGAGKLEYTPGKDSCGASLSEMAEICDAVGMVNAVNLDGGGSAQILLNNRRSLLISDRNAPQNTEAERPIPLGLIVK